MPNVGGEPGAVPNPPAQHVPTAMDILKVAPPRAPQAAIDLPAAVVGAPYRAELPSFTDHGGKDLRLSAESVPGGLSFHDLGEGKGLIDGAPTLAGGATMRIQAVYLGGRSAQMVANLVIEDRPQQAPGETSSRRTPKSRRRGWRGRDRCSQSPTLKRQPSVRTTASICRRSAARPRR